MKSKDRSVLEMEEKFSPVWPHGEIKQVFHDVYMVTGTNIIFFDGLRIQASRNMIIVRENHALTLINTVRLDDQGLKSLDELGSVKNIIRIGAFHGRDDAFYQQKYNAKLWAISSMEFSHGEKLDFDISTTPLPLKNAKAMAFQTTKLKEAVILLNSDGGILISCDSIKNWTKQDHFFDEKTFLLMKEAGSVGEAIIDNTWLSAMAPKKNELEKILSLDFKHLLSAHGEPLKYKAKSAIAHSIEKIVD
jgi:hypothetical protein